MNKIEKIVIHHSLSDDGEARNWNAIRKYHLSKGWKGIGYHYGIERVGALYQTQYGRVESVVGAHTLGLNARSLGYCFVGNYDRDKISEVMLAKGAADIAGLCYKYGLTHEDVDPHSKYAEKSCPGTQFPMNELKRLVRYYIFKYQIDDKGLACEG